MDYLRLIFKSDFKYSPVSEIKLSLLLNSTKSHNEILADQHIEYETLLFDYPIFIGGILYSGFYPYKTIQLKNNNETLYIKRTPDGDHCTFREDGPVFIFTENNQIKIEIYNSYNDFEIYNRVYTGNYLIKIKYYPDKVIKYEHYETPEYVNTRKYYPNSVLKYKRIQYKDRTKDNSETFYDDQVNIIDTKTYKIIPFRLK